MSSLQQLRLLRETEDERAARISRERREVDIHWDGHLPLLGSHDFTLFGLGNVKNLLRRWALKIKHSASASLLLLSAGDE